ncbi:MAG TPA: ABC transporter permease, partial [Burkholderiaceae bacterium]|nr:ABC transporter permease [Burkholderiaceae bacterium]
MQKILRLSRQSPRSAQLMLSLGGLATLVLLWGLSTHWLQHSISLARLLSPQETFDSLVQLLAQNQLTVHTLTSLKRVLVGLALALVLGVPIGLAVGTSRALENSTGSTFQFLRMISPLSWMPIAVM